MTRAIISIGGQSSWEFLQGLFTNDVPKDINTLSYSAMLSPQGKLLFDFFIFLSSSNTFYIDIENSVKDDFLKRVNIYKLRQNISIQETEMNVLLSKESLGVDLSMRDPRNSNMGFRTYFLDNQHEKFSKNQKLLWDKDEYELTRVKNCIPRFGVELISNETYILEANFINLSGVSFTKGCFIGQEVTARMKHKTVLQKGLKVVQILDASKMKSSQVGDIIFSGDKKVGHLLSMAQNYAIAYLRLNRITKELKCNGVSLTLLG